MANTPPKFLEALNSAIKSPYYEAVDIDVDRLKPDSCGCRGSSYTIPEEVINLLNTNPRKKV